MLADVDANPSSTAGMIDILKRLNQYIIRLTDDEFITLPTDGDCSAVKRILDAKRVADFTALESLEGFEPMAQEFNHYGLMIQVYFVYTVSTYIVQLFNTITIYLMCGHVLLCCDNLLSVCLENSFNRLFTSRSLSDRTTLWVHL